MDSYLTHVPLGPPQNHAHSSGRPRSSGHDVPSLRAQPHKIYCPTILITLAAIIHIILLIPGVLGQQLVNGQLFSAGLAISNAPAPNSQFTVGGNIPVSVEISGNGRLQFPPPPASSTPTAILSLEIFLISLQNSINLTISRGPQFLQGEPGSTVKHLTWQIPECLPGGDYEFTYYELSKINQVAYFSITPVPIRILRPSGNGVSGSTGCAGATRPTLEPQLSSSPPSNPFLDPAFPLSSQSLVLPTPRPTARTSTLEPATIRTRLTTSISGTPVTVETTLTIVETTMPTRTETAQVVMGTDKGDGSNELPVLFAVNGQPPRLNLGGLGLAVPLSLITWCCF